MMQLPSYENMLGSQRAIYTPFARFQLTGFRKEVLIPKTKDVIVFNAERTICFAAGRLLENPLVPGPDQEAAAEVVFAMPGPRTCALAGILNEAASLPVTDRELSMEGVMAGIYCQKGIKRSVIGLNDACPGCEAFEQCMGTGRNLLDYDPSRSVPYDKAVFNRDLADYFMVYWNNLLKRGHIDEAVGGGNMAARALPTGQTRAFYRELMKQKYFGSLPE